MFRTMSVLLTVLAMATSLPAGDLTDAKKVAAGNNQFATDLYARLRAGQQGNLFFSPFSISTALAMTDAGAKGETEQQMSSVLHFTLPQAQLHPAFLALQQSLVSNKERQDFQLRVANRLWGQQGYHFLPEFLKVTKDNYGAELGQVDFVIQSEEARQQINKWVEDQTANKIKDLLAPGVVNADTRLVLVNAIYFKARWLHEFSPQATKNEPFHVASDKQESVSMMHQSRRLSYAETDDTQVLELPYGHGTTSMIVLLPKKADGLAALEKGLTSEALSKWTGSMAVRKVNVSLPKFKMTSTFSLNDVLSAMGMKLAFTGQADFSGMSTVERLFISAVIHKAFVDVNEEGTEAAAATAVAMEATAMRPNPEEPIEFRADHPFVFMLRDRQTGSILFMGRVMNPKE